MNIDPVWDLLKLCRRLLAADTESVVYVRLELGPAVEAAERALVGQAQWMLDAMRQQDENTRLLQELCERARQGAGSTSQTGDWDHTQRDRVADYVRERRRSGVWDLTTARVEDDAEGVVHVHLEYVRGSRRFVRQFEIWGVLLEHDRAPLGDRIEPRYRELMALVRETP
jgi:hypothetical protein